MTVRRTADRRQATTPYDDPVTAAARIVDYAAARQAILARLPDDVLAVIAFLACDDAVTAAYDELERRRA